MIRDHIIFVCTANVCRSPIAEKLLQHALAVESEPYCKLVVTSAGLAAWDGQEASRNSMEVLKSVELDLSKHRSKKLTPKLVERAFAIFCMTQSQLLSIKNTFQQLPKHLYLMRSFLQNDSYPEITDPYGLDLSAYLNCRDNMVEAIPSIIHFIKETYKANA
jgi:protein-tyrosine-phosphatase